MKFIIEKSYNYFCCSTLALLNGDIQVVILDKTTEIIGARIKEHAINYKDILSDILVFLKTDYSLYKHKMYRSLKIEYKRMIKLYEFRLKRLEELIWKNIMI